MSHLTFPELSVGSDPMARNAVVKECGEVTLANGDKGCGYDIIFPRDYEKEIVLGCGGEFERVYVSRIAPAEGEPG